MSKKRFCAAVGCTNEADCACYKCHAFVCRGHERHCSEELTNVELTEAVRELQKEMTELKEAAPAVQGELEENWYKMKSQVAEIEKLESTNRVLKGVISNLDLVIESRKKSSIELKDRIVELERVLDEKRKLTRELDVAMHGEDEAAQQAALIDLIASAKAWREEKLVLGQKLAKISGASSSLIDTMHEGSRCNTAALANFKDAMARVFPRSFPSDWLIEFKKNEPNRCRHDVVADDCFECYPTLGEK